jgi:hypothetical protein
LLLVCLLAPATARADGFGADVLGIWIWAILLGVAALVFWKERLSVKLGLFGVLVAAIVVASSLLDRLDTQSDNPALIGVGVLPLLAPGLVYVAIYLRRQAADRRARGDA